MEEKRGKLLSRPSWDQYFMSMAELAATRSTCIRRKVGAVLVKNSRIISTGYNGAPAGYQHCQKIGCMREQLNVPSGEKHELCRGVHAEQNAIIQAALHGISTMSSTLYCTSKPCSICAKMIVNAGILNVVYRDDYNDELTDTVLFGLLQKFEGDI